MDFTKEIEFEWAPIRSVDGKSIIGRTKILSTIKLDGQGAYILNSEIVTSISGLQKFQDEAHLYPEVKQYFPIERDRGEVVGKKEIKSIVYLNPINIKENILINNFYFTTLDKLKQFQHDNFLYAEIS